MYDIFATGYQSYTPFSPMHLEEYRNVFVLHWSLDLEPWPNRRISDHEVPLFIVTAISTSTHGSTPSHLDVVPPMTIPQALLYVSRELSFDKTQNDTNDKIPILAWEVAWWEERTLTLAGWATKVHNYAPVHFENRRIESHWTNEENMIAREVTSAAKEWLRLNCWLWLRSR